MRLLKKRQLHRCRQDSFPHRTICGLRCNGQNSVSSTLRLDKRRLTKRVRAGLCRRCWRSPVKFDKY